MLGALSDDGARVWIRTINPARVRVLYGDIAVDDR
jgi:hypothetical protein